MLNEREQKSKKNKRQGGNQAISGNEQPYYNDEDYPGYNGNNIDDINQDEALVDNEPQPFNYDPSSFVSDLQPSYRPSPAKKTLSLKKSNRSVNANQGQRRRSTYVPNQNEYQRKPKSISQAPNIVEPDSIETIDEEKSYTGVVQNFYRDKEHGFIRCDDLPTVTYFKDSHILCEGVNFLIKQQMVEFKVTLWDEDKLCATLVKPLELSPTQKMMQKSYLKRQAEAEAAKETAE